MPVLTQQEYDKKKSNSPSERIKKVEEVGGNKNPRLPSPPKKEYFFFHPENPASGYLNKKITPNIYGKVYELEIINGVVKTDSEIVASYLFSKEYTLIKEVENGQTKN
jgi:hypothetical protein